MKLDFIKECIEEHKAMLPRYQYLENLYLGFHNIFKKPEKPDWKPEHRLAVGFPRYIADTFIGYAYGKPIKLQSVDEEFDQAKERRNYLTSNEWERMKKLAIDNYPEYNWEKGGYGDYGQFDFVKE